MQQSNAARLYAGIVGAVLVVAGIAGFFHNAAFNADPGDRDAVFGLLDVNGWHNLVHILTGALGLLAFSAGAYVSRFYAFGLGVVYAVIAIWGFALGGGESILGFIPINTADNLLHLAIAVLGLVASQMWVPSAVVATALLFGIGIPAIVSSDHDTTTNIDRGKELFASAGCRNCHTLSASGSLGTIGPDLDQLKPNDKQVLAAIENGGTGSGSMPGNLASGQDAEDIAAYVADATGATSPIQVSGPPGKQIFVQNCGSCHTLADAGTSGTTGPDLDRIKPSMAQVLAAIKAGPGVMPANLVSPKQARQVADYVSSVAGR
jgi:cytochrome c6